MEAIVERVVGLDVHQGSVVAYVIVGVAGRRSSRETRTFGVSTQRSATVLPNLVCNMPSASSLQRVYGRRARRHCHRSLMADADDRRPWSGAMPSTPLSLPSSSPANYPNEPGGVSLGAKVPIPPWPHALPPCECGRHTVIISARSRGERSGASSSGLPVSQNPRNTGVHLARYRVLPSDGQPGQAAMAY
jgi:hypothetical protein